MDGKTALEKASPVSTPLCFGKGNPSFGKGKTHALRKGLEKLLKTAFGKGLGKLLKTAFGKGLGKLLENSLWERA